MSIPCLANQIFQHICAVQTPDLIMPRQPLRGRKHPVSEHQSGPNVHQSTYGLQPVPVVSVDLAYLHHPPPVSHGNMGYSQSSTYYFGIVNVSFDHLDVLSFVLGVCFAVGVSYCYSYCKHTRRASRQVLGKSRQGTAHQPQAAPFWSWPSACRPAEVPSGPPPPSAPPTTLVPWPTQQCQ